MFITIFFTVLMLGMLVVLHVHAVRCDTKLTETKTESAKLEQRRAVKARNSHCEYTVIYVIMSAMLEYMGFFILVLFLMGLSLVAHRAMYVYSILVAESYVDGKLASKPVWRIRGMRGTKHTLIGLALMLLIVSFRNIFH